jgi:hypothetical protein
LLLSYSFNAYYVFLTALSRPWQSILTRSVPPNLSYVTTEVIHQLCLTILPPATVYLGADLKPQAQLTRFLPRSAPVPAVCTVVYSLLSDFAPDLQPGWLPARQFDAVYWLVLCRHLGLQQPYQMTDARRTIRDVLYSARKLVV